MALAVLISVGDAAQADERLPQEESKDGGGLAEVHLPVKRLHSRHRRNISPGTRWDWLVGWETVSETLEIQVKLQEGDLYCPLSVVMNRGVNSRISSKSVK